MPRYASGKKAVAISDRSGMEFPYHEMVREWNGSLVHITEFEPKQPQLEPKPISSEGVALRNIRPDRVEPPVALALPKDPFTVTNGSATLTVSLLNHTLEVGDFVLFYNPASNDPAQSFNLGSNLFPIFATADAITASATTATFDTNTNFPATGVVALCIKKKPMLAKLLLPSKVTVVSVADKLDPKI